MTGIVLPFRGKRPRVSPAAWVAMSATLIGDVELAEGANIWFGAVLRADLAPIRVGTNSNIQDGTVVHVSSRAPNGTRIGAGVTVGHMALIHGCVLEDFCFVGMKACVMDGVVVETGGWVAAGAVVSPRTRVPKGQIWAGNPARFLRDLTAEEKRYIETVPERYRAFAEEYRGSA